jgi:hypothetical protein
MNTEGLTTAQIGGSARGYLALGGRFSSPGMAYWMVACSVYSCIAILGVNVRICREGAHRGSRRTASANSLGRFS